MNPIKEIKVCNQIQSLSLNLKQFKQNDNRVYPFYSNALKLLSDPDKASLSFPLVPSMHPSPNFTMSLDLVSSRVFFLQSFGDDMLSVW